MFSKFRSVMLLTIVFVACMVVLIGTTNHVQAQGPVAQALPLIDDTGYQFGQVTTAATFGKKAVAGGTLVAIVNMDNNFTPFLNVGKLLHIACSNVNVYRVTNFGDLIMHQWRCAGNRLTFSGTGSEAYADYYIVAYSSQAAAASAPKNVLKGSF